MDQHGLATRAALRGAGFTDDQLRRHRRDGLLHRVVRGTYTSGDDPRLADARHRHLLALRATLARAAVPSVASHVSAALVHRLQVWDVPVDVVHVTRDRPTGGRRLPCRHVHAARLPPDDITSVDGIAVTTVARTVVDLARTVGFEQAVALADGALRSGLIAATSLTHIAARFAHLRGGPNASRASRFADGRAESVGESRSRVALDRAGLPTPRLQWDVYDGTRRHLGRTDFAWPEQGVVGEFDGRIKYARGSCADPAEALWAEKRREDALRATGLHVVRWVWSDLADFAPVAARLRTLLQP